MCVFLEFFDYAAQTDSVLSQLSPSDEDMPKLQKKYLDDVQTRIKSSANNLLAMAAPLESSSISTSVKPKVGRPAAGLIRSSKVAMYTTLISN